MNRFLGKLTIHIGFLLEKLNKKFENAKTKTFSNCNLLISSTSTFVFNLQRRSHSDHVSGCLMFNAAYIRSESPPPPPIPRCPIPINPPLEQQIDGNHTNKRKRYTYTYIYISVLFISLENNQTTIINQDEIISEENVCYSNVIFNFVNISL